MFNSYFSAKYILDKKSLFNIVLSDRSDGKTFDCKVRALEDYAKNKHITIYMRRFKTEIPETLYKSFFNDVLGDSKPEKQKYREKYGQWQFRGSKTGVEVKTTEDGKWDWIIFFIPLTMSGKLKSNLDPFVQRIFCIDFDEYIPLDGRYAQNEMTLLMEFWKSVDRDRDILQLFVAGNRIVSFNPFFDYFNLDLSITGDKIRLYKNDTLAVQIYSNKEHRKVRNESRFNQLVEGTQYEEYNNGGILETLNIKVASHVGATYWSSFMTSLGEGTIWSNGQVFIISSYKRKDGFLIVDKMYNTGREEYHINFGKFAQLFKRMYKSGAICFEDEKTYHLFEPILRKIWN